LAKGTVLVVEDEPKIAEVLEAVPGAGRLPVVQAATAPPAWELRGRRRTCDPGSQPAETGWPGGLPRVRRESALPIIMLTARDEEADKLVGLELGADDYITSLQSPRRRWWRGSGPSCDVPQPTNLPGDPESGRPRPRPLHATRPYGPAGLDLTPTEFRLLEVLMGSPGRVFSRLQLLDLVQGEAFEGYERTSTLTSRTCARRSSQTPAAHLPADRVRRRLQARGAIRCVGCRQAGARVFPVAWWAC